MNLSLKFVFLQVCWYMQYITELPKYKLQVYHRKQCEDWGYE